MSLWFPLHCHTHYSLLDGLSQTKHIVSRLKECGYTGSAITDHGTISGCPEFNDDLQKKDLKPILGCEFYVTRRDAADKSPDNRTSHLCVLAKGEQGWRNLMRASSASYMPEVFYRKPRLDLDRLASYGKGEFITFSGHLGSDLADICFKEPKLAYQARTYADAKSLVREDWREAVPFEIRRYQEAFGPDNFFLEIQLIDCKNLPAAEVVANILRYFGKKLGVPCVATADSHYARRQDAADQRVILCSSLNTTFAAIERQIEQEEDVQLGAFFKSNSYHIPDPDEMRALHGDHPEELANSLEIAKRCQSFKIGGKPLLPNFDCPPGMTPDQYLLHLCEKGWKKKVEPKVKSDLWPTYRARLNEVEYPVIEKAGLAPYFLIKQDLIRYATEDLKSLTGPGRGSAAGCFISYLLNITRVDPIKAGLIFERFYNDGRNSPGRIAMPDIDSDFGISIREKVIEYARNKYGHDKVAQMATFARMQGRGALKDVLRARGSVDFETMNRITEHIPDEAEIADKLQEMREESETGEASIIQWALLNNPEPLREWAFLNEESGKIDGPLGMEFAQAIRLEGTKRSMGKHASGLVICSEVLADIVPMCWDRSAEQMLVAVDMRIAEKLGLLKLDILGLRTLDCIMGALRFRRTGRLRCKTA